MDNKVHQADCLEFMKTMPDKSCDVFTDPPYNVGKNYGIWNDSLSEEDYTNWISKVLLEIKRVSNIYVVYVPKKWNLLYWTILGQEAQEIILPFNPSGAIRYGYSNQFNKLLTNARPKRDKPILNVWQNMPQPGLGFFFRENTYDHPGYTSQAITLKAINELTNNPLIYDPFMGTGTTAVACLIAKRSFCGTELNPEYCEIANKRIKEFQDQGVLCL